MVIDSLKYNGPCSCGKEHKMETVFSVIESGCLKNISQYMEEYGLGGYTVAVYDDHTYSATADRHPNADFEIILPSENLHANEHGVALLSARLPAETEVLIAVGSGTIHDIVRYCAYQKGVDFVSCPTAASVDGFCSSVAAMTWNGCKKTLTAVAPKMVVADIDVIKNAPIRLAKSGFGDMVGKYVALTDWKIASVIKGEFYCSRIADMTLEATEAVVRSVNGILQGEKKAFANLTYGLLLSGLAMQMMGNSRPASGAEHHISHIIEMEPKGLSVHSDALHGEKVGVGTLLAIAEYKRLCEKNDPCFQDYKEFGRDQLLEIFGEDLLREIVKENENDAAKGITAEDLKNCRQQIFAEVNKLPDINWLRSLYLDSGIKATLSEIGVDPQKAEDLLNYSPCVRNRLTLMRIKKCL